MNNLVKLNTLAKVQSFIKSGENISTLASCANLDGGAFQEKKNEPPSLQILGNSQECIQTLLS